GSNSPRLLNGAGLYQRDLYSASAGSLDVHAWLQLPVTWFPDGPRVRIDILLRPRHLAEHSPTRELASKRRILIVVSASMSTSALSRWSTNSSIGKRIAQENSSRPPRSISPAKIS